MITNILFLLTLFLLPNIPLEIFIMRFWINMCIFGCGRQISKCDISKLHCFVNYFGSELLRKRAFGAITGNTVNASLLTESTKGRYLGFQCRSATDIPVSP